MSTSKQESNVDFDKILATNSDIVGQKWWASGAKKLFEYAVTCNLTLNPVTAGLLLAAFAGSYVQDFHPPIARVPINHPKFGKYDVLKVRTMVPEAREKLKELLAQGHTLYEIRENEKHDDRVAHTTWRYIRRTSLDEIPQMYQLLNPRFPMALVGPRNFGADEFLSDIEPLLSTPEGGEYLSHLQNGLEFGVFGLASVFARHANYKRRFAIENEYAKRGSFAADVRILCGAAKIRRLMNGI